MKLMFKKVAAGIIAASVVFGGAGLLVTLVSAAETTTETVEAATNVTAVEDAALSPEEGTFLETRKHGKRHKGMIGGKLMKETAAILGIEESAIKTELQAGKTFAEIAAAAGLSKEDYLAKLVAAISARLDDADNITGEKAAELEAKWTEHLTKAIEANPSELRGPGKGHGPRDGQGTGNEQGTGNGEEPGKGPGPRKGHGFGHFANMEQIAALLNITNQQLKEALKSGRSIAEIAAENNITEALLIEKIKDSMDDKIKEFVNKKRIVKSENVGE